MTRGQTSETAVDDLSGLLDEWPISLAARNRSAGTIDSYTRVGRAFLAFLAANGMPTAVSAITREHIEHFLADLLSRLSPATAAKSYRSLQQLFKWLVEEGDIQHSPMERMSPPTVPEQPVPVLSDDDIRSLLAVCAGRSVENRRDLAIIRLFIDSGIRAGELVGIGIDDVDLMQRTVRVTGKGGRDRIVSFGAKTTDAIRKWLKARRTLSGADRTDRLWLGRKGPLSDSGVRQMLERRGQDAGVDGLHPHRFRHTFAHLWLLDGGQETDLMRLAGWRSQQMVGRYGASAGSERAGEAHRRAAIGDRY